MPGAEQIRSHAGLRGIAALLVVGYHLQYGTQRLPIEDATDFFKRCYLFVDLFFVLSGFIISYTNAADHPRPLTVARYRDFIGRRFARLYPLLIFTLAYLVLGRLTLSLLYRAAGRPDPIPDESLLELAAQAAMVNAWLPNPTGWNLPTWSISAEMFAYLCFPLLVAAYARWPRFGVGLLTLPPLAFYGWVAANSGSLDIVGGWAPLRCLAGFALGMIVYRLRDRFVVGDGGLAAVQIGATVAIILMLAIPVNDVLLIPCFALLVGSSWQDRGPVARALAHAGPVALGTISYSIYLNHVPLLQLLGVPWGSAERALNPDPVLARTAWIVTSVTAILLVSRLTYLYVEVPGRKWLATRLLGHRVGPLAHSPAAP